MSLQLFNPYVIYTDLSVYYYGMGYAYVWLEVNYSTPLGLKVHREAGEVIGKGGEALGVPQIDGYGAG